MLVLQFDGDRPLLMRVEASGSAKLYEHISISICLFNNWHEDSDVVIRILKSPDYDPVEWSRDSTEPIISSGENQVRQAN